MNFLFQEGIKKVLDYKFKKHGIRIMLYFVLLLISLIMLMFTTSSEIIYGRKMGYLICGLDVYNFMMMYTYYNLFVTIIIYIFYVSFILKKCSDAFIIAHGSYKKYYIYLLKVALVDAIIVTLIEGVATFISTRVYNLNQNNWDLLVSKYNYLNGNTIEINGHIIIGTFIIAIFLWNLWIRIFMNSIYYITRNKLTTVFIGIGVYLLFSRVGIINVLPYITYEGWENEGNIYAFIPMLIAYIVLIVFSFCFRTINKKVRINEILYKRNKKSK